MNWIRVLLWLLPRRLRSSWVALAVTAFGVVAAVTLMATGGIYSKVLAEGGLRHTLASTSPIGLDAQIVVRNRPLGPADYLSLRAKVEKTAYSHLDPLVRATHRAGRTQSNLPLVNDADGQPPSLSAPFGQPFFLTGFREHTTIVEGRWPDEPPSPGEQGLALEVVMGKEAAADMRWDVGTTVYLVPFPLDPSDTVALTVVGLAEPTDPTEEYWLTSVSYYFDTQNMDPGWLVPMYVDEASFFDELGASYPALVGDYWWLLFLDTSALTADAVQPTKEAIVALEADLNQLFPRSLVFSLLEDTLSSYQRELALARVPLFLFLSLVVAVVLYFLVQVLHVLAQMRSDEASLLRSRGAGALQLVGLYSLVEGAFVLVAVLVGPLLTWGIVRALLVGTIAPVEGGEAVPLELSAQVYALAAVGGVLSMGTLLITGAGLARGGMVDFLRARARPPTVPLLHRYYLDVLALAVMGLTWWQLKERGGFVQRDVAAYRVQETDLSMLVGPVLALLAGALLLLRFLPLLLRALAFAANLLAPAWVSFTITRMARDPLPHSYLAIILMVAATLGVFGASFQSTLARSQQERVLHQVGGQLVVKGAPFDSTSVAELYSIPGVEAVSPVNRSLGTLIGIDPDTFADTAWFRDDFADKPLSQLLAPLQETVETSPGIPLPAEADGVGVWVKPDVRFRGQSRQTMNLWVRLVDASGSHRSLLLGELPTQNDDDNSSGVDWTYLDAALPSSELGTSPPLNVVSLYVTSGSTSALMGRQPGSLLLDDITARMGDGAAQVVVESYERGASAAEMWTVVPGNSSGADSVALATGTAHSGRNGLSFSWEMAVGREPRGILVPTGPIPLPVIGDARSYQVGQRPLVRSGGQVVPVVVREVTRYFPSIPSWSPPYLLVNLSDYTSYMSRMPGTSQLAHPEELWVAVAENARPSRVALSIRTQVPGVTSVQGREAEAELARRNPLAGGSWDGLTLLGVLALTVAVAVSLSTFGMVAVRGARIDLTMAGALGFSRLQIRLSVAMERVLVAAIGVAAGTASGVWLSRWVLGFLDLTPGGEVALPPMLFTLNGALMALVYGSLTASLAIALLLGTLAAGRLRAADNLRAGP